MAAPAHRSAAQLFNNSALSDVTILQFDANAELHEYRAHKAILCMESQFFRHEFTELHPDIDDIKLVGDDKLHFELLLKYIYTNHYDTTEIENLAVGDITQRVLVPMGICVVADKYIVPTAHQNASDDLRTLLLTKDTGDFKLLKAAITAHYDRDVDADSVMGNLITSVIMAGQRTFTQSATFEATLKTYPTFAVDVALAMTRDIVNVQCHKCQANVVVRSDTRESKRNVKHINCSFCTTLNHYSNSNGVTALDLPSS